MKPKPSLVQPPNTAGSLGCSWTLLAIGILLIVLIGMPSQNRGPSGAPLFKYVAIYVMFFYWPVMVAAVAMIGYTYFVRRRQRREKI